MCAIWYFRLFFGEKGFVHAVWYLDLDSCCVFFDFSMVFQHGCSIALQFAVAFLNQFWTWSRQRRRRGRRPHDVNVRCLKVHGTIHLLCAIWCFGMFFVRKVLCMQFGTLIWIIDMCSFIAACHFYMVAASLCICFAQCVGRGQGSAAGAAEDHMK